MHITYAYVYRTIYIYTCCFDLCKAREKPRVYNTITLVLAFNLIESTVMAWYPIELYSIALYLCILVHICCVYVSLHYLLIESGVRRLQLKTALITIVHGIDSYDMMSW